ncbi:mitochondrial carnitine:acyl carnitine carrier [Emiliania huxleyi CCMP1516]|uniref:Mitochondrial carrier protein n=2 Tax=Emiliania huxleyi TaxID=2903 RepID=A0A0D3KBE4_EMIH1|nr:mitochondrial carnitine:acyl carnitine carrier [Emiliania huxleyi CCMP1516]EOD33079.1 mitochondrial carnitine:acyl carnitine carrier [Emiliania huxleyi CCMP1516]|eukprot:XP_005785508.1 mitochondrial carnitine:acyl carnitine carrier [Emiliania huxleyi CCMP1516]
MGGRASRGEDSSLSPDSRSTTARHTTSDALLAGGFGGACLCVVGAPFDVVKVRQQQTRSDGASPSRIVRSILRAEGVVGLWRGVGPPLMVAVPQFALVFGSHEAARALISRHSTRPPGDGRDAALAGALVAVPTTFVYTPVDRVKLAMQSDGRRVASGLPPLYSSASQCARQLWRSGGAASFSRGFFATLARDVPGWASYFYVYSAAKRWLTSGGGVLDGTAELSPVASLAAGREAASPARRRGRHVCRWTRSRRTTSRTWRTARTGVLAAPSFGPRASEASSRASGRWCSAVCRATRLALRGPRLPSER